MSKEIEEAIKILEKFIQINNSITEEMLQDEDKEIQEGVKIDQKRCKAEEILIKHIKELEEAKRITELTKISCCTAQNCAALENAIRKDLENDRLKEQLETIRENAKQDISKLENQLADSKADLTSVYLKRSI